MPFEEDPMFSQSVLSLFSEMEQNDVFGTE